MNYNKLKTVFRKTFIRVLFVALLAALFTAGALSAQNSERGIVPIETIKEKQSDESSEASKEKERSDRQKNLDASGASSNGPSGNSERNKAREAQKENMRKSSKKERELRGSGDGNVVR